MATGAVKVAARIRKFMPWEAQDRVYELENGNDIGLPSKKKGGLSNKKVASMEFMTFNAVFGEKSRNIDIFKGAAKELCDGMLEAGCNALLFAYGQTGSGKTYTLLGTPGRDNEDEATRGVLPQAISYLLNHESGLVKKASFSVCEVYATGTSKIEMFDLLEKSNQVKDWNKRKGKNNIELQDLNKRTINKDTNVNDLIKEAQKAGHYAPTGKNPHSSRGHCAFITTVYLEDGRKCNFVVLDLAGSEGITAITPEFTKKVGEATAKVRLMEGGAINYGLSQIQGILKEVGSAKGVSATQGNGIRKLLWKFVQKKNAPLVRVLFTLSPSRTNIDTTRDTFRVAEAMANLKIKPVKVAKKANKSGLILQLKKQLREAEFTIKKLRNENAELQESGGGAQSGGTAMQLRRQMTVQANQQKAEALGDSSEQVEAINYNSTDLQERQEDLKQYKQELQLLLEEAEDDEEKELLNAELEDVDDELNTVMDNLTSLKEIENEFEAAVSDSRQSIVALDGVDGLASLAEDDEDVNFSTAEANAADGDYVSVKREELKALKDQIEGLAQAMEEKKQRAKKRNAELAKFVAQLDSEHTQKLTELLPETE